MVSTPESKSKSEKEAQTREKKGISFLYWLIPLTVIGLAAFFLFKPIPTGKVAGTEEGRFQETLRLSYSLSLSDGTEIRSGTDTFVRGAVASRLGLVSDKLDSLISDLSVGEEKSFTLQPADSFGLRDESLVVSVNRSERMEKFQELNRTFEMTKSRFVDSFGSEPEIGQTYSTPGAPWNFTVLSIEDGSVSLRQDPESGQRIPFSPLLSWIVSAVTEEKILIELVAEKSELDVEAGQLTVTEENDSLVFTLTPTIGETVTIGSVTGKVVGYNETTIRLDTNPLYAGETVIVTVKLLEVTKTPLTGQAIAMIPGAPTLEVFVMTHCPYGTQIEKGLLPVYDTIGDKANILIRFVSYIMHGEIEERETRRQLCIREEQGSLFWPYLRCFLEAGDSEGCLVSVGIDEASLNSCMTSKADSYWEVDKNLNERYGVRGSPTVVLDGEVVSTRRSPQALLNLVCSAFSEMPTECSTELSDETPSPGFGLSATATRTGTAGTC